jgi:hypothetical protein
MKKSIVLLFIFFQSFVQAQVVGTPYITPPVELQRLVLDQLGVTPSFAFSTRKLREGYTGFALRIRRSTDNAQADVAFDNNNVVSDNSMVTVAVAGGVLAVGNTLTLASFRSGSTLFVTTWYDQGSNGWNGVQNNSAIQPVFSLGVAGPTNQYASLVFSGLSNPQSVVVNQPMQVLLGNVTSGMGLRGTVGIIARPTANSAQFSFGYSTGEVRWSSHMNWSDGNCYVDLGDARDINRSFINGAVPNRLNVYKQYLFIRANATKTMRVSGLSPQGNNLPVNLNSGLSGGSFGIGNSVITPTPSTVGFSGNMPEFILFPEPLTVAQYSLLENNQISFWGSF